MAPATAIAANTRLTYRHQRHDRYSVSTPPRISPTAPPPDATEPKTPKALPRSRGSVNVLTRVPRADGARTAPNAPCSARAVTKTTNDPAAPPIAEAMANPTRPVMNTHLRLNMSPSRPPTSSRLPNASAYADTNHCRSPLEKPSACWADGSAMFTIVPSSTSISWATAATTRTSQRRSAGAVRRSRVAEGVVTDVIRVPSYGPILAPSQVKSHHHILVIRAPKAAGAGSKALAPRHQPRCVTSRNRNGQQRLRPAFGCG